MKEHIQNEICANKFHCFSSQLPFLHIKKCFKLKCKLHCHTYTKYSENKRKLRRAYQKSAEGMDISYTVIHKFFLPSSLGGEFQLMWLL